MHRLLIHFVVLNLVCYAEPQQPALEWPKYFDLSNKGDYCFVSIFEDGHAEFLERKTRGDGSVWLHYDPAARWGYFRETKEPTSPRGPSIWIATKKFRFDYRLEDKRLVEIDKMGVQKSLLRRENSIRIESPPESKELEAGTGQRTIRPEPKTEEGDKAQPEAERRSR